MLPPKLPRKAKRASRWRSQAHCNFVRSHACSACGSSQNIQAAHVRLGSHTGGSQKPDDWRTVSLCEGPNSNIKGELGCHNAQHFVGERSFWKGFGIDPEELITAFIKASPRRAQIEQTMKERGR
jgi:hypothetical protein